MLNQLITALGTVYLSYICCITGVHLRIKGQDQSWEDMIITALRQIPIKHPRFFFVITLPVAFVNNPAVIISISFILTLLFPRHFVHMILICCGEIKP